MSDPLISVIIATYNRSNVLALAIESVRWQTRADWELLVVGDACTDDTESIVATFTRNDPRIHFFNLATNVGEQSGPNNAGAQRARGRYIAYLNHDDLWLPDHLETLLRAIEETGADLVFSVIDFVERTRRNHLSRIHPVTRHDPPYDSPASCWLFRRGMVDEIGAWRFYQDCHGYPSQDWLFRAWKAGKTLQTVPRLTVVAIQSNRRAGSYSDRQVDEQQSYFDRIANEPDFRMQELATMGFASEGDALLHRLRELTRWRRFRPLRSLPFRLAYGIISRLCIAVRINPSGILRFARDGRKGGRLDDFRRTRGLPPLARRNQTSTNRQRSG